MYEQWTIVTANWMHVDHFSLFFWCSYADTPHPWIHYHPWNAINDDNGPQQQHSGMTASRQCADNVMFFCRSINLQLPVVSLWFAHQNIFAFRFIICTEETDTRNYDTASIGGRNIKNIERRDDNIECRIGVDGFSCSFTNVQTRQGSTLTPQLRNILWFYRSQCHTMSDSTWINFHSSELTVVRSRITAPTRCSSVQSVHPREFPDVPFRPGDVSKPLLFFGYWANAVHDQHAL